MIREDTFPATVLIVPVDSDIPVEQLRSRPPTPGFAALPITRVSVSERQIWVVTDAPTGPQVVFEATIDPSTHVKGTTTVDSRVVTTDGIKIVWRKDSSCGCGSRLRSWRPFKHMGSSRDPQA